MPSSSKTTAVQVPTTRAVRSSPSSKDEFNYSNGSSRTSTGSQMATSSAQDTPRSPTKSETATTWTYRVRGIPIGLGWECTTLLIQSTLKIKNWELRSLAPDPIREREQVATFEVLQPPYSTLKPRPDSQWQFSISHIPNENSASPNASLNGSILDGSLSVGDTTASNNNFPDVNHLKRHKKSTITVDKHFLGLTPLNRWDETQNYIEYSVLSRCRSS